MEALEEELQALSDEKATLEAKLSAPSMPYGEIQATSERIGAIISRTDEVEMRLLELYERSE